MISKIFSFNALLWEHLKKHQWLLALNSVVFFFVLPVYAAICLRNEYDEAAMTTIVSNFGTNVFATFFVCLSALTAGAASFLYLHRKSQVDFYHALPLRREYLFGVNFAGGVLLFLLPFAINMILAAAVFAAQGYALLLSGLFVKAALASILFFLLIYSLVVLAGMLTGDFVIHILGAVLFFFLPLAFLLIFDFYMDEFFSTYFSLINSGGWIQNTSPVIRYFALMYEPLTPAEAAGCAAAAGVCAALALLLYRCRPSEAAGHAIAFPLFQTVVKYPLLLLSTLLGGVFFSEFGGGSYGWAVFGMLCGLTLGHCLLEVIFHFDFKALFRHKKGTAIFGALLALVLLAGAGDWFGYDKYLPAPGQVKQVNICLDGIDQYLRRGESTPSYMENFSFAEAENINAVLRLAARAAQITKPTDVEAAWAKQPYSLGFKVVYTLQSGRRVWRSYAPAPYDPEALRVIFESEEYKAGAYFRGLEAENTQDIVLASLDNLQERACSFSPVQTAAVLAAYRKDMAGLTVATMEKECPLYTIKFISADRPDDANWAGYDLHFRANMEVAYPVYPSFTHTRAALRQAGAAEMPPPGSGEVASVTLIFKTASGSTLDRDEYKNVTISDPEQVNIILERAVPEEQLQRYNPFLPTEDIGIEVIFKDLYMDYSRCVFPKGSVPEEVWAIVGG